MKINLKDASFTLNNLSRLKTLENLMITSDTANLPYSFKEFNLLLKFRDTNPAITIIKNTDFTWTDSQYMLESISGNVFDFFADINIDDLMKLFELSSFLMYIELSEALIWYMKVKKN